VSASEAVLGTALTERELTVYRSYVAEKRDSFVHWAYIKLRSTEDARDVVNEAFTKLYLRWDDALSSASTDAFSFKILHDTVADALRKRDRQPSTPAGLAFEPSVRPVAGIPDDEIDQVGARMEIHQAVDALPHRQRTCVTLHYLLGYPADEVADITGLAISTVYSHLASARVSLAQVLRTPEAPIAVKEGHR
jgi:RNA polymerase sigma-70 factor (ECF subfamily)